MEENGLDINKPDWFEGIDKSKEYKIYRENILIGKFIPQQSFVTKDVKDIIGSSLSFFIPSYQRGYRWDCQQVEELLNDIWDWNIDKSEEKMSKYCLQPIVLFKSKVNGFDYDVVDGQQRLTTIFIIMQALKKFPIKYSIEYETRAGSAKYLKEITEKEHDENIDYYHIFQAYQVAENFFQKKNPDEWFAKLIDEQFGAFFIEYTISSEVDTRTPEQIFTGLNAGKIPLTNSELVKGLLLKKNNFTVEIYQNEYLEIAQEWDRIEKRLREPNFWAWLGRNKTDEPHIDFIFDIVADLLVEDTPNKRTRQNTQNFSYHVFTDYLKKKENSVSKLWLKIKSCCMTLEDWYADSITYHLVGYLNLPKKENEKRKKNNFQMSEYYHSFISEEEFSFKKIVREDIKKAFENQLKYEDKEIYKILLLFNIVTCINNKMTFHFDWFTYDEDGSPQKYDVEHIFPHSESDLLKDSSERLEWIEEIKKSHIFNDVKVEYKGQEIPLFEINTKDISENLTHFSKVYEKIIDYGIDTSNKLKDVNILGNLCLLDKTTNRGYGNKPFPNKVKDITEIDARQSQYILPCTKNVFLKYYSGLNINNYVWTQKDAEKYESKIKETILKFFEIEDIGNE